MLFNDHSALGDKHAFLSPSQYHWLRYSDDKMADKFHSLDARKRGTELHAFAAEAIRLRQRLEGPGTLASYVNDAIEFNMTPEQPLYFSEYCFGTADAISFDDSCLRIHDLKTGEIPASMEQLEIYAALFCLEYGYSPKDISMELRIYQNNEAIIHTPDITDIMPIADRIVYFDKFLRSLR